MTPRIVLDGLGKAYLRYPSRWRRVLSWLKPEWGRSEADWVLRGLSLTVTAGQSLGIIGRNGAGKSTLLKLLTGNTHPSTGAVQLHGSVAALLELGMGFHPEFTGRHNALLGLQMHGMAEAQAEAHMEAVAAFADIGHYLDHPVRTYSSGMQVRLAFSVATVQRPDILIVDEALSVGDAAFQHKCFARMRDYKAQGTTLLFVSHDPGAVRNLCDRAVLIERGQVVADGEPDQVLDVYNALIAVQENEAVLQLQPSQPDTPRHGMRSGDQQAEILAVRLYRGAHEAGVFGVDDEMEIRIQLIAHARLPALVCGFMIRDRLGNEVFGTNTFHLSPGLLHDLPSGHATWVRWHIPRLSLGTGSYSLSVALHSDMTHIGANHDWWDHASVFQVHAGHLPPFVGVCHLPGVSVQRDGDPLHADCTP